MIVDVIRRASVLNIERTRILPIPGRVLVNEGAVVQTEDVIAEAEVPGKILMLDIAKGLRLSPEDTMSCLVRETGETLLEGDVVAQCDGAFPRLVRTPVEGKFIDCVQGKAIFATGKSFIDMKAAMVGTVIKIIPEFGAVIKTRGSLLQGLWGNGCFAKGSLAVQESSFNDGGDKLILSDVESGQIVAVGACLNQLVLKKLVDKGVAGLVLGVLGFELLSFAAELPIPVVVLQGFNCCWLDPQILKILKSRTGESACLNASPTDAMTGHRPELIVPGAQGEVEKALGFREKLSIDRRVQILSGQHSGTVGTVFDLPRSQTTFGSGLSLETAMVELAGGEVATVPEQNLLIVG